MWGVNLISFITIAFMICAFYNPSFMTFILIPLLIVVEGFYFISTRPKNISSHLDFDFSEKELEVISKYFVYFTTPLTAKKCSSYLSLVQLSTFIMAPLFLYHRHWFQGVFFIANYFFVAPISVTLNPRFFLHNGVEKKGKLQYLEEMKAVDSVCEKIINK